VTSERGDEPSVETDHEPGPEPAQEPLARRRILLLGVTALVVLAADIGTKLAAVAGLEGEQPVRVLGGLVHLQLVRNSGAAFSMATGMTWVLSLIAISVVMAIVWIIPKLRSAGWAVGLGLVLAGALGNLSDRIFRAPGPLRGHVIDFVSVLKPNGAFFPVFNVADSAIVVGGGLIVLMALLGRDYDGRPISQAGGAGGRGDVEASR
jgi:signal peptidase II